MQLRAKLKANGGTLYDLATNAFKVAQRKSGERFLVFTEFEEGSESYTNAHQGAMSFGQGCAMRIRNLLAHGEEPAEQELLESLASLSLLARWIDDALLVTRD